MRTFLSERDQRSISEAIATQESRTQAEMVTVVADASDSYRYIPVLWASIISMFVPGLLYISGLWTDFSTLYTIQVMLFLALAFAFRQGALKFRLIPKRVLRERAARMARQQFFEQRLHHTEKRLGVLLFVSVAERYVEILADSGASDQIKDQQWQHIVAEFSLQVAKDRVVDGFIGAIEQCGDLLAAVAPQKETPVNALPNKLVILDSDDSSYVI